MDKTEGLNLLLQILVENHEKNLKAVAALLLKQSNGRINYPDLHLFLNQLIEDKYVLAEQLKEPTNFTEDHSLKQREKGFITTGNFNSPTYIKGFTDLKYSITLKGWEYYKKGEYHTDLPVSNKKNGLNGTDKLFIIKLLQINSLFPQFDPKNEGSIVSINDLIAQLTGISSAKEVAKLLRKTIDHTILIKDLTKAEIPSKLESLKKIRPIIEKLKNEALTTSLNDLEQKVKNKQSSYN